MHIIAFGGLKGSGKSTCASILEQMHPEEVYRTAFAKAVREVAAAFFGVPVETFTDPATKEVPTPLLRGFTPREVLRNISDAIKRIDNNFWVKAVQRELIPAQVVGYKHFVIDDLRFPHEVVAVREWGGTIIFMDRGGVSDGHVSEQVDHIVTHAHFMISNRQDIDYLRATLEGFKL